MPTKPATTITAVQIRMYRMGTGDCFALKFMAGETVSFRLMIDCGTWQGSKNQLSPYIKDLKIWVDGHFDLLVVTHEHKDHVYGFEACEALFSEDLTIQETWLAWTENDADPRVQTWIKDYGQKKKALAAAVQAVGNFLGDDDNERALEFEAGRKGILAARELFATRLNALADIQFGAAATYAGNLKGMKIVKEKLAAGNIKYKEPGQIISDLAGLPGINIYVLGPPLSWDAVKKEAGGLGESYPHNNELTKSDAFASAVLADTPTGIQQALPFDRKYLIQNNTPQWNTEQRRYFNDETEWQNIDFEWLQSAGMLALRVNSMTNNLSLALAFEIEATGKVLLFPGDAEYGSWLSWQMIKWKKNGLTTESLLNRTVFYKVAHHMSHNGTAQRCGLEMMIDPALSAMATLDYNIIAPGWKSTMPNAAMTESLIQKTRGRLMIMQEKDLYMDRSKTNLVSDRIAKEQAKLSAKELADFKSNCESTELYLQMNLSL
jgi:beta-lactamase superfamily II metal-dependent hydrolase